MFQHQTQSSLRTKKRNSFLLIVVAALLAAVALNAVSIAPLSGPAHAAPGGKGGGKGGGGGDGGDTITRVEFRDDFLGDPDVQSVGGTTYRDDESRVTVEVSANGHFFLETTNKIGRGLRSAFVRFAEDPAIVGDPGDPGFTFTRPGGDPSEPNDKLKVYTTYDLDTLGFEYTVRIRVGQGQEDRNIREMDTIGQTLDLNCHVKVTMLDPSLAGQSGASIFIWLGSMQPTNGPYARDLITDTATNPVTVTYLGPNGDGLRQWSVSTYGGMAEISENFNFDWNKPRDLYRPISFYFTITAP